MSHGECRSCRYCYQYSSPTERWTECRRNPPVAAEMPGRALFARVQTNWSCGEFSSPDPKSSPDEKMYYSLASAARSLRVSEETIRGAIRDGELRAWRVQCLGWVIQESSLLKYRKILFKRN